MPLFFLHFLDYILDLEGTEMLTPCLWVLKLSAAVKCLTYSTLDIIELTSYSLRVTLSNGPTTSKC